MPITPDGPVLLAQPALLRIPAGGTGTNGGQWPWPGVDAGTPQPVLRRRSTRGSPPAPPATRPPWKQVVGDPDPNRSYLLLSGVTLSSPAIGPVGWLWGDDENRGEEALPHQALLRATVGAAWTGQTPAPGGTVRTLTYDLLLDKADAAAPAVVAWGSPGAPLTKYTNAVTGRTLPSTSAPPTGTTTTANPTTNPSGADHPSSSGGSASPRPSGSAAASTTPEPEGR